MSLHDFLVDHAGRGVLLQIGQQGVRGLVHDVTDMAVVLWNPKRPFLEVPLDAVDGFTGWCRFDQYQGLYEACVRGQTCALHYPAA